MIRVSVTDLGPKSLPHERLIGVLKAYFDDSGTHAGSPLVVLGGLLGTAEQWDTFGPAWQALLDSPLSGKPPLVQFHLSACRAASGEFEDYGEADRNRIQHLFRHVILDAKLFTFASAVDKTAWDELVVGPFAEHLGDPLGLCLVRCISQLMNTARFRFPGQRLEITVDEGVLHRLRGWNDLYLSQRHLWPEISQFGFAKVADFVELQGADMIATETYTFSQQWLANPADPAASAHFRDFQFRDLSAGRIILREHIEEMIERVRTVHPDL